MARSEQFFIELCKKQIEEKFSFGNGGGYTQRDLEILAVKIDEQTGVVISLSTLKRLWKGDYKQSPQIATLNALAMMLGHKDWQEFKIANSKKVKKMPVVRWAVPVGVVMIIGAAVLFSSSFKPEGKFKRSVKVTGPVLFEASTTVTSGVPNTVIFKYDVSNVEADTFFIQQSWNNNHRWGIDREGNAVSRIYYESGFHRAKLIANDSILTRQMVHILSDGWEPHLYYNNTDSIPIMLNDEKFISNGELHLDSALLVKRNVDYSQRFYTRVTNSRVFDVHSDNFTYSTRMKGGQIKNRMCAWVEFMIVTDVHVFMVMLTEKGCETNGYYKLGEIEKVGQTADLSALGCNIFEWQDIEIRVKDRTAGIYLNGKLTYEETYKQDMGKIVAVSYIFDGTGSVDHATLKDGDGKVVFEDGFGN
jgi:hypothetical protein